MQLVSDAAPKFSHFPNIPPPARVRLATLGPQPCAYLADRMTTVRALVASEIDPSIYAGFLDANFRRSGTMLYQPTCVGCRQCRSIRVPVDRFAPTRSQRRSVARNADLRVDVAPLGPPTAERFDLYTRYTTHWHDRGEPSDFEAFAEFLHQSPTQTLEFTYRDPAGTLLGVGICDVSAEALSSVYFYFDPDAAARSLGTFSVMREIAAARDAAIPRYHLGYWVEACPAMAYKANFRPAEVLHPDGIWRPVTR